MAYPSSRYSLYFKKAICYVRCYMIETTKKEKTFCKAMGARLRAARESAGFTQVQLAEELGITQSTLTKYETGSRRIPVTLLPGIAKTLETDYNQLLDD